MLEKKFNNTAQETEKKLTKPLVVAVTVVLSVLAAIVAFDCAKVTAPADTVPPAEPANFMLLGGGDGEVHLRWTKNTEPDFSNYVMYRSVETSDSFHSLVELRQVEYVDRFLDYETMYFYYITAVDFAGNASEPSQIIDVQPLNISSPPKPTNLLVSGRNNPSLSQLDMQLTWTPPNVSDVALFRIFRGENSDFVPDASTQIDSSQASTYIDRDVRQGELFHYKIIAVDRGLKISQPSNPDNDRILLSTKLINPANRTTFSRPYILSWSAVDHAISYQVFVGRGPMSNIVWSSKTTETEIPYAGPLFSSNTIYYWWVGAFSKEKIVTETGAELEPEMNCYSEIWAFFVE